jgi:hypothetical protein
MQVRIGLPVVHNPGSSESVAWRFCNVGTQGRCWQGVERVIDDYAARAGQLKNEDQANLSACHTAPSTTAKVCTSCAVHEQML